MKTAVMALFFILLSSAAGARSEIEVRHATKVPHNVAPPLPMAYFEVTPRQRIYTPDRYSCYIRQKRKYCVDDRGRALNGQIVVSGKDAAFYETYQNGYQNGETSVFSNSGILLERSIYKKGVKHGEAMVYYPNGNVRFIMKYKDGALNGRVEEYDINGALLGQMTYKKGWFKEGSCRNERSGHTMHERLNDGKYNQIIPCGVEI